jgi:hypothetical protein
MKLSGKIEDVGLGEILQIISFSQKSGIIWLKGQRGAGSIVFKSGQIVRATSRAEKQGVCDLLVKENVIPSEKIKEAREIQGGVGFTDSLGTILIRDFNVKPELVEDATKKLIGRTVYSFFILGEGTFIFEQKEFEENAELLKTDVLQYTLPEGMNPQYLAMEGARLHDEALKEGVAPPEETAGEEPPPSPVEHVKTEATYEKNAQFPEELQLNSQQFRDELISEGLMQGYGDTEPVVEESKGLRLLKDVLVELSRPLSMSEIVLLILRFSSEMMSRAVLFTAKSGNVVGLGQYGIELEDDIPDRRIRKMKIPLGEPSILREAIVTKARVVKALDPLSWNDYIVKQLGGHRPVEAFAAPVMVHGKVAFILYGDNAPVDDKIGDTSSLEIFLAQTSMALERLVLKRKLSGSESTT